MNSQSEHFHVWHHLFLLLNIPICKREHHSGLMTVCLLSIFQQSWSNNEIEQEVNYTTEIEEVVGEQRRLVAEEMMRYPYPNGQYNNSARFVFKLFKSSPVILQYNY